MTSLRRAGGPRLRLIALFTVTALVAAACGNGEEPPPEEPPAEEPDDAAEEPDDAAGDPEEPTEIATDFGVDVENQVLRIGTLDDLDGPGSGISVPYAVGKQVLVEQVNSGALDVLPEGWTIDLIERDHEYNPAESVRAFNEIKDDVLFFATVFGTPNTLPLVEDATREEIALFPASLSSELAVNEYTPPIGAPYKVESHHAVQFAIEDAEARDDIDEPVLGILYQLDDYGEDGIQGIREAAEFHGIELDESLLIGLAPGETDVAGAITTLQGGGATHVLLTVLPSSTGPVLGTAAQLEYFPIWVGNTPAWIDVFFDPEVLPPPVYQNYRWATGLPLWGEDIGWMDEFIAAYEEFGSDSYPPDFYILASYSQGLLELEAFSRALANGDVTRAGYYEALRSIDDFDAFGLWYQPMDLTEFPYATQTDTRILAPGEDLTDWEVVQDYRTPDSWGGL